jgi:hypothetical protein
MPEQISQKIDQQQQRIEAINDPEKLKQKVTENRNILIDAVDQAQRDLSSSETTLESPEAKNYLHASASEISDYLRQVADHGCAVKAEKDAGSEVKDSDLVRVSALSAQLAASLSLLKQGIESFRKIEDGKKQVDAIILEDERLDQNGNADIASLIQKKEDLVNNLQSIGAGLPNDTITAAVKARVDAAILERQEKFTADILGLKRASEFKSEVETNALKIPDFEKAVAEYEKNPSDNNFAVARAKAAEIDFGNLEQTLERVETGITKKVFDYLWEGSYKPAKEKFGLIEERLRLKENEIMNKQVLLVLETVQTNWESAMKGQWDRYELMDYEEKHENKELEDNLLRQLLATKGLLGKFTGEDMKDRLEFTLSETVFAKHKEFSGYIAKIEGFRITHANDVAMGRKNISKYVRFDFREGKGDEFYNFTEEFHKLPEGEQARVRLIAEEISANSVRYVRDETAKIALESANPEEKMKILTEILGEKGKLYFDGLKKLESGDGDDAVTLFNEYLSQPFTAEESELHKDIIADAKEKVKGIMAEKLAVLDSLFEDVKALAYARSKMVGNPELRVDVGHEADAISAELAVFRQDIADGKVMNFEERYAAFKSRVSEAVKNKQQKETDLLKLLNTLHDVSREKDPEKRKAGFNEFAKQARESQAYNLAMKYLDYALADELNEASKKLSKADVLKKMLSEPEFISKLNLQAQHQLEAILRENPEMRGQLTLEHVKDNLLNRALDERYKRELRRFITPGMGGLSELNPALANYNNWFPIDDPNWYEPWNYGAAEWDEFQMDCVKFVWESLPSLGIGMAAGAAGRVGARAGGKLFMKYLVRNGLTQAEIAVIEHGGLAALRASVQSGRQLSFAATRLFGSLAAETATVFSMGLGMEYLQSGRVGAFDTPGSFAKGLSQTMIQMSLFRIVGLGLNSGPIQAEMQKGLIRGSAVWLATESLSGAGGAGIEYAFAKMDGRDYSGQDAFKAFMMNYLMSVGMRTAMGAPRQSRADRSLQRAYEKNPGQKKVTGSDTDIAYADTLLDVNPPPSRRSFTEATQPFNLVGRRQKPSGDNTRQDGPARPLRGRPTKVEGKIVSQPVLNERTVGPPRRKQQPSLGTQDTQPSSPRARDNARMQEATAALNLRLNDNSTLRQSIDYVLRKNNLNSEALRNLDPAEIKLLAETDVSILNERIIEKIIKREHVTFEDVVNGESVKVRYYADEAAEIARGGFGKVTEGYFAVWETNGSRTQNPKLRRGAIKEPHLSTDDSSRSVRYELETLRQIRDNLPAGLSADGLLLPYYVGKRVITDVDGNFIRQETITITERVDPYPGAKKPDLSDMLITAPPEVSLDAAMQALNGLRTLHAMGRMHLDIKPGNVLAGILNGRTTGVLGDLATTPFTDLSNMHFKMTTFPDIGNRMIIHYPDSSAAVTPTYFSKCYKHMRCQQEWLMANPGKKPPDTIVGLADKAQWGHLLHRINNYFQQNPNKLPPGVSGQIDVKFKSLIRRIHDVPNMDRINRNIESARRNNDENGLKTAMAAKERALRDMENHISVLEIQQEMGIISSIIKQARPSPNVSSTPTIN